MKRFTETEKWRDPWFSDLPNDYKLIWLYILDNCDNAGIYKISMRHLQFDCNVSISKEQIAEVLKDRIYEISEEKWYITKFCEYQYGDKFLNSNHKAVASARNKLLKEGILIQNDNGIYSISIPYQYSINTLQEQEQDKVKDKNKVKDKAMAQERSFGYNPTKEEVNKAFAEFE